jgi:hypothetical protein
MATEIAPRRSPASGPVGLISQAVNAIALSNETCTPKALVEYARPKDSPLHSQFEWNDKVGGEAFRELQAASMIRSVRLISETGKSGPAYVSIRLTEDGNRGYVPVKTAMDSEVGRAMVLQEAKAYLVGGRHRYAFLTEYAGVWQAIDEAVTEE